MSAVGAVIVRIPVEVMAGVWRSIDQGNTWTSTDMGPCSDREWIAWGGPNAPTGPLTLESISRR